MNWEACGFTAVFVLLGAVIAFLIFRRKSWKQRLFRLPIFLTCALPLLYLGVVNLPVALEPVFTRMVGHSIWDMYHFPKSPNGTEFSETWWVARWQTPIQHVVFGLVPIGIIGAFINAIAGREPKANVVGALVGVALATVALYLFVSIGQFF
jgi:hypothetical protein